MYVLRCTHPLGGGRVYVGQRRDVHKRYDQHRRTPPSRMAADVRRFQPFHEWWQMEILSACGSHAEADTMDQAQILAWHSRGPNGYNIAKGRPALFAQYHTMRRRGAL